MHTRQGFSFIQIYAKRSRSHLWLVASTSSSSERSSGGLSDFGVDIIVIDVECRNLLVPVQMRAEEEEEEICGAEGGQKPVEQIQAASIEIIDQPWLRAPVVARHPVHHGDEHGA